MDWTCEQCGSPFGRLHDTKRCVSIIEGRANKLIDKVKAATGKKRKIAVLHLMLNADLDLLKTVSQDLWIGMRSQEPSFIGIAFQTFDGVLSRVDELIGQFTGSHHSDAELSGHAYFDYAFEDMEPETIVMVLYSAKETCEIGIRTAKFAVEILDEVYARPFDSQVLYWMSRTAHAAKWAKSVILKKDPSVWTPELEVEFREYLDYKAE